MILRIWMAGLTRQRPIRIAGTALGVALTVALVALLGYFLIGTTRTMTTRAIASVPIDWQVEALPGSNPATVRAAIGKSAPVAAMAAMGYAKTAGFQATTGQTVQTTGPGVAISMSNRYRTLFPGETRLLSGKADGVLIAQQTAANLHVRPGDTVQIQRPGLGPVSVTVDGVVGLPNADALFQGVGLPRQARPQAPPDNVLILPQAQWQRIFDPQAAQSPSSVHVQFHVRLRHDALPSQPTAAYMWTAGAAHNLEARVAGKALVANNLGVRLDAVRGDSLYATVLFLFLGLPGVALAGALTIAVAASSAARRRAEQALLRIRGASQRMILGLYAGEAALTGATGAVLGLVLAAAFARLALPVAVPLLGGAGLAVAAAAVLTGLALAALAVLLPAWRSLRYRRVAQDRQALGRDRSGRPVGLWLGLASLAASGLLFWQTAASGYQIVLAPEGVPATAVDYKAFLAPALFWIGAVLLIFALTRRLVRGNGTILRGLARPFAGRLAPVVSAALSHQSRRLALGVSMAALALAFGVSTAIFNTTYRGQARVDAQLTNGSDVTVFGSTANPAGPHLAKLAALPGVAAAQPMQHRFAYVGVDLQDIYGINPATITRATSLKNAYFQGGTRDQILSRLRKHPDGLLVSAETVRDFQLNLGDRINLRLMNAKDHQYHTVPFRFVGVAREFPTAPKDSFLVANAAYIAKMTGSSASEYVLLRAKGAPTALSASVHKALAGTTGLKVKDLTQVSHIIGSSLTAVNVTGLTRVELAFALAMAAAAAGLMLALGFADRRSHFAVLSAIGARPRQLAGFLDVEAAVVFVGGTVLGLVAGTVIAWMLVRLLSGVFDPPPEWLSFPLVYLGAIVIATGLSVLGALALARRLALGDRIAALKDR